MRETHAFAIVKELKAKGHPVAIEDQPKNSNFVREDDVAIVGGKGMKEGDVGDRVKIIRSALTRHSSPYTIEMPGTRTGSSPTRPSRRGNTLRTQRKEVTIMACKPTHKGGKKGGKGSCK